MLLFEGQISRTLFNGQLCFQAVYSPQYNAIFTICLCTRYGICLSEGKHIALAEHNYSPKIIVQCSGKIYVHVSKSRQIIALFNFARQSSSYSSIIIGYKENVSPFSLYFSIVLYFVLLYYFTFVQFLVAQFKIYILAL